MSRTQSHVGAHAHTRRPDITLLLILLAALAVRCWDINARSLWFDEAGEYWVAIAPLRSLVTSVVSGTGDPPLYSFLLHVWMTVASGPIWLRSLSVVASLAGIAGVMTLAHRLAGRRGAIAAGALMAVLPADVRYAQEVGQYALMLAAIAWNLVALHILWSRPRTRTALGWAATAIFAAYTYYGAAFSVAVPFLCVMVEAVVRHDGKRVRALLAALALCIVGLLPLVLWVLPDQMLRVLHAGASSARPDASHAISLGAAGTWLNQVLAFQFTGWPYTRVPAIVPVAGVLALLVLSLRAGRRTLVWLAATWVIYFLADVADIFPYGFRWGLILTPLLVALAGTGVASAARGWMRAGAWAVFGCLLLAGAVSLPNRTLRDTLYGRNPSPWPETEDVRGALAYWQAHRRGDQPTYVYYGAAPAFAYYTRDAAWARDLPPAWFIDCWHRPAGTYCGSPEVRFGRWTRDLNATQRVADVFGAFAGTPKEFWVFFSHLQPNDDRNLLADLIANGYRIGAAYQATGADVFLLERQ
jgi:hypothetical protein